MPDDASLDDFLGAGGESDDRDEGADAAGAEGDDHGDATPDPPSDAVAPATATATWTPGGAACADCGDVVERRWRDGDAFVCSACKEW